MELVIRRDLSVNNLQYLNSYQALADLASFITQVKAANNWLANSKVERCVGCLCFLICFCYCGTGYSVWRVIQC